MSPHTPITLTRFNLGERHHEFNALVAKVTKLGEPIEDILELPEKSAIDRLFKINLASNHKHVQYILKNLKDDDMLYVSSALNASKWLLGELYKEIINPVKLENDVYPEMILPAANKMKHWIYLNLQDETRCQEFYHYYCENNRKLAMKYLLKCPTDLIIKEIPKFLEDDRTSYNQSSPKHYITPHYFKMFCERTPLVAKVVYDMVYKDTSFRLSYIDRQYQYFEGLKCILKSEPDIFLDIAEKHFNVHRFSNLKSTATRFILTHKKERFLRKPELYAAWLLDVKELAKFLSSEECEELVIKLVRAKFLHPWFDYIMLDPLVMKINKNKRVEFKKRVFIRKEVGEDVKDWPYPPPGPTTEDDIFEYEGNAYVKYDDECNEKIGACLMGLSYSNNKKIVSHVDNLFNEYRFKSFSESLYQLSQKILAESSPLNRMHMMLVLVSKTGSKEGNLGAFLNFLVKHRNEPPQVRAAVIRSLVRRASIWRVSDDIWVNFLKFGEGLWLNGGALEAECKEGLHAVAIRSLIKTSGLTPEITSSFLKNFSSLTEYPLSMTEKTHILRILPILLLELTNTETNSEKAVDIMDHLLDTLEHTEDRANRYDNVIPTVKKLLERDEISAGRIFRRLFKSKIGRKELVTFYFDVIQRDESYVNVLKHDIVVFSMDQFLKAIVIDNISLDRFLSKASVYFAEDGGLASRLLNALKKEKPHFTLARPISFLIGANFKTYLTEMDEKREVCKDDKDLEKFCAALRANAHLARPAFDIDDITWRQAGVKLIANKILICRSVDIEKYIEQSLSWKRSVGLATVLAKRTDRGVEVLQMAATMRPTVVIKVGLDYFRCDKSSPRIWKTIKPLIPKLVSGDKNIYLMKKLEKLIHIPESIRPEYIQVMYPMYLDIKTENENFKFTEKCDYLIQIHKFLPKMEPQFIENLLLKFFENDFTANTKSNLQNPVQNKVRICSITDMHVKILAKFILICKNENEQNERFTRLGDFFFDILDKIHKQKSTTDETHHHYLKTFLCALKSNSAFFSNEYVSCLQVMKNVVKRMRSQLPVEEYFILYVEVHLTMLYYLAVKNTVKKIPKLFVGEAKDQKKNKEGMQQITRVFGKYIAREAKELSLKYFESAVDVYSKGLKDYFFRFREPRHELSLSLVKGIIEGSERFEGKLAIDLYNEYHKNDEDWNEIRNLMIEKFDKNMMFFIYNDEPQLNVVYNHGKLM